MLFHPASKLTLTPHPEERVARLEGRGVSGQSFESRRFASPQDEEK